MKTICREANRYYFLIHTFYEPFLNHKRLHILHKQIGRLLIRFEEYTFTIKV